MIRKLFLCSALLFAAPVVAAAQTGDGNIISLQQADIRAFIDDVADVTGYTFLVDPRVQGQVTVSSSEELTDREVFQVFKQVLRNHGYTAIRTPTGEYRITLLQGAAGDAPFTEGGGSNGQLATTVVTLYDTDAAEAAKLIKPVLNPQGILTANAGGRTLVITDFPENIAKARAIVDAMEAESSTFQTVGLTNLSSLDAEETLQALTSGNGNGPSNVRVVGVPANNSVVLEGPPREVARLERLLRQIDGTTSAPRGAVSVVPIRYGDGATIAEVIASLVPGLAVEGQPLPTVAFEPGSNTLIINAPGELQRELETIVRQLDQRRPQVMVEAMIVEISDTLARDLGVEFALAGVDGNDIPLIGTNFSRQPGDLIALTGALGGDRLGLDAATQAQLQNAAVGSIFGLNGGIGAGASFGGDTLFSVILNAVETDDESNVLSTPFVTTLDNIPATFLVGQEIPIIQGETLGAIGGGGGVVNPFRTFDREDVGIKLEVLPQITEGDVIRMEIKQEVSSIAGAITTVANDFVLNKREIGTTVLADSGEIIVLGGLIQDDEQVSVQKVPLLGDIPVAGALFRSEGKSRSRTNLMVFLRPTILRTGADARPVTATRIDQMRRLDRQQSGRDLSKVDTMILGDTAIPGTAPRQPLTGDPLASPSPTSEPSE